MRLLSRSERAVPLGDEGRRGVAPGGGAFVAVEIVEVRQEILAPAGVHQRMEPGQHQDTRGRRPRRLVVHDQHAQGRLTARLDGPIELGRQLAVKLSARGDGRAAHGRASQALARSGGPVQLAPWERTPQARRGPGAYVEKPIPRARDAVGVDRAVALDHEHGVVAEPDAFPAGMMRQQHEIRPAQGQSAHVSLQRGHEYSFSEWSPIQSLGRRGRPATACGVVGQDSDPARRACQETRPAPLVHSRRDYHAGSGFERRERDG